MVRALRWYCTEYVAAMIIGSRWSSKMILYTRNGMTVQASLKSQAGLVSQKR
jgi:hypothetical protein